MTVRAWSLALGSVCLLTACGGGDDDGVGGGADGGTVTDSIGPAGGTVTIAGAELTIPAGALEAEVEITITETAEEVPGGFLGSSAIYQFEPDGLVFAQPVAARIDFTGDGTELDVIWSTADGTGFTAMGGAVDGTSVVADITHFSRGFAGHVDPGSGVCSGGCPPGEECVAGQCVVPGGGSVACNDGEDNDADDLIDDGDDGCFIPTDESEKVDCNDGVDNDGDSLTDYAPPDVAAGDPGCTSATDGSERPACGDGFDNDSDGHTDLDDPDCGGNPNGYAETPPPAGGAAP